MSGQNQQPETRQTTHESARREKQPFGRVVLFVGIVFFATGAAVGVFIKYGIPAIATGAGGGVSLIPAIGFLLAATIGASAVLVFKK
ncbi:MAG: hypothetical protein NTV51_10940 [Verrucomicrobia bacterium]|nr:hypothetical protein [Verrucomicrobiota bacterium]